MKQKPATQSKYNKVKTYQPASNIKPPDFHKIYRLDQMHLLNPVDFENFAGYLFKSEGWRVETTKASGDEGVDLFLFKNATKAVVQCKRYKGNVGQPIIRDLYGSMMHEQASIGYAVTTGSFTERATTFAIGKPIKLIDGVELVKWAAKVNPDAHLYGQLSPPPSGVINQPRRTEPVPTRLLIFSAIVVSLLVVGVIIYSLLTASSFAQISKTTSANANIWSRVATSGLTSTPMAGLNSKAVKPTSELTSSNPATTTSKPPTVTPVTHLKNAASQPCEVNQIKGNRQAYTDGQHYYHLPGWYWYDKLTNVQCFDNETQAQAAGYKRSNVITPPPGTKK